MMVPQELNMIVSSDPTNGASNRSSDGSYFEIQLQHGLDLPKDALSATLSVEQSEIWWTVANIKNGVNDKFYITGPSALPVQYNKFQLGYPSSSYYSIYFGPSGLDLILTIGRVAGGMPTNDLKVNDKFIVGEGVNIGKQLTVLSITSDTQFLKEYVLDTNGMEGNIGNTTGPFEFIQYQGINSYIVTIEEGLYDLSGLNKAIVRDLEMQGAVSSPSSLVSFSPNEATQKVEMFINYDRVIVDFNYPNTVREILGFNSAVYGPYPTAPLSIFGENEAKFNTINYFLIHTDLTTLGIRFNNDYNQAVAQVLIDVAPGSQIVSKPYNPPRISVQELVGATRRSLRFWLTDDKNNRINTAGEYWSCRLVIRYFRPFYIGTVNTKIGG